MRWSRIGVMLHETSEFRPLLGFCASRDGGLILSPGKYVPAEQWRYGRGQAPGGRYVGIAAGDVDEDPEVIEQAPKLHYHRSGFVSIDMTERAPKRTLVCVPIPNTRGDQCFGFTVVWPRRAAIVSNRPGDLVGVAHGEWPARVDVLGFLYGRDQLPMRNVVRSGATGLLTNERAELVVDLAGHGVDAVLVIRIALIGSDDGHGDDPAEAWLFGFDYRVTMDTMVECLGMWTSSSTVKAIPLCPPDQAPFRRLLLPPGATDMRRVQRKPGAGPTAQELL